MKATERAEEAEGGSEVAEGGEAHGDVECGGQALDSVVALGHQAEDSDHQVILQKYKEE